MPNLSVAHPVNMETNFFPHNFVKPVDDEETGWRAFFAGRHLHDCANEAQRTGWKEAQAFGLRQIVAGFDFPEVGVPCSVRW